MKTLLPTLFFSLALAFLPATAQEKPPAAASDKAAWDIPAKPENFHIFLLMGQSNMAGYGGIAPQDPYLPGDKDPVPYVLVLDGQGTSGDPKPLEPIAWRPGAHRLHLRQNTAQFGLGMDFAREYLKTHPGVTVGLIPCAWGGAAIDSLKKGTPIYANALARAAEARKVGTIKGVLWHQGESDTVSQGAADAYEKKLHQLVADLRQDLGDSKLLFIAGNLAEFYGTSPEHNAPARVKWINLVRDTLRTLPQKVPNTGFAESTGCTSADAHMVHFDRKSYIILGQRYAQALEKLQKQ